MDIILLIANMVILSIVAIYFARATSTKKKDVEYTNNKHEQNMVEQESNRNVSEEKLLRLGRENLAMEIMLLRDKQVAREITFKESLKQSVSLIEEYE